VFDEDIFMYIEDADLDYRMRRAGWRVMYVPVSSIVHEQRTDGYDMFSSVSFLLRRNSVHYLAKTGRLFQAWGYAGLSLSLMFVRSIAGRAGSIGSGLRFTRALLASYWRLLVKGDTRLPSLPAVNREGNT
jgi:GT2 family glycosyltransferase